jgi:hypothetical protein
MYVKFETLIMTDKKNDENRKNIAVKTIVIIRHRFTFLLLFLFSSFDNISTRARLFLLLRICLYAFLIETFFYIYIFERSLFIDVVVVFQSHIIFHSVIDHYFYLNSIGYIHKRQNEERKKKKMNE